MYHHNQKILTQLLNTITNQILPKTVRGVEQGNKIFGAAILDKISLDVIVTETNNELANPLFHGEITCLNAFFAKQRDIATSKLIFLSTHEPCSMCLSAITWAGFNEVYYFFSHEDSRDNFEIPHDLKILKELFNIEPGGYNKKNSFLQCYSIIELIENVRCQNRSLLMNEAKEIKSKYQNLSLHYQESKNKNSIPFK